MANTASSDIVVVTMQFESLEDEKAGSTSVSVCGNLTSACVNGISDACCKKSEWEVDLSVEFTPCCMLVTFTVAAWSNEVLEI